MPVYITVDMCKAKVGLGDAMVVSGITVFLFIPHTR